MNYLKLPHMDGEVSVFDICQAHAQLESDYNIGGIVRERPSNSRRNMSTGCQLHRMQFNPGMRWVDICNPDECDDPDDEMREFMRNRYVPEFLNSFKSWGEV